MKKQFLIIPVILLIIGVIIFLQFPKHNNDEQLNYTPPNLPDINLAPEVITCESIAEKNNCNTFAGCFWNGNSCEIATEKILPTTTSVEFSCNNILDKQECEQVNTCYWNLPKVSCPAGDDGSCLEAARRNATCRSK